MAVLRFTRPHDAGGALRRLLIEVDGRQVAALKPGKSAAVPVAPGSHAVQARMDWCTSRPLALEVGETDEVHVEATFPATALWDMVRRPASALVLRERGPRR
jgi:hypothetical protein